MLLEVFASFLKSGIPTNTAFEPFHYKDGILDSLKRLKSDGLSISCVTQHRAPHQKLTLILAMTNGLHLLLYNAVAIAFIGG